MLSDPDPDPDPRKEIEVDPDPDLDPEQGLKWIRFSKMQWIRVDPDPDPKRWQNICMFSCLNARIEGHPAAVRRRRRINYHYLAGNVKV